MLQGYGVNRTPRLLRIRRTHWALGQTQGGGLTLDGSAPLEGWYWAVSEAVCSCQDLGASGMEGMEPGMPLHTSQRPGHPSENDPAPV